MGTPCTSQDQASNLVWSTFVHRFQSINSGVAQRGGAVDLLSSIAATGAPSLSHAFFSAAEGTMSNYGMDLLVVTGLLSNFRIQSGGHFEFA